MNHRIVLCAAVLLGVACGSSEEEEQQAQEQAQQEAEAFVNEALNMATEMAPAPAPSEMAAAPAPSAAGGSNFGTITLQAGFMPDPHTASGTSGGGRDASSLHASCAGWIDDTPDHLLVASSAFSDLRVMVHSSDDTTLVIEKPDGTYTCNDDSEGLNPLVSGNFPEGTYKIWIGSYEQGTNSQYTLGISELSSTTPSSLAN